MSMSKVSLEHGHSHDLRVAYDCSGATVAELIVIDHDLQSLKHVLSVSL